MQACIFYLIASTNIGNSWVSKLHFDCCDPMLDAFTANTVRALHPYRVTSLIRNCPPPRTLQ